MKAILDKLLNQDIDEVVARIQDRVNSKIKPEDRDFILYGAGTTGRFVSQHMIANGIVPKFFCDDTEELWGAKLNEIKIIQPQEALKEDALFIITSTFPSKIIPRLSNKRWCYFEEFYLWLYRGQKRYGILNFPYVIFENKNEVLKTFKLLADKRSKEIYLETINYLLTLEPPKSSSEPIDEMYFWKMKKDNEVFIDGGAYIGDTIHALIKYIDGKFKKIYAFEPDPVNFQKLYENTVIGIPYNLVEKITITHSALWRKSEHVKFRCLGEQSSRIADDGEEIIAIALDDVNIGMPTTRIKLDIEGAEIQALEGAVHTIRKDIPVLAVSACHSQQQFILIPQFINKHFDNYKIYLRRYRENCWDLIYYAFPN